MKTSIFPFQFPSLILVPSQIAIVMAISKRIDISCRAVLQTQPFPSFP